MESIGCDDDLFLNMLVNASKRRGLTPQKLAGTAETEALRKCYKEFEETVLASQIVLSSFPEFVDFTKGRLSACVADFEKYVLGKKD